MLMMDNIKKINVQDLVVTPQDDDNTYIGLDENGNLIRTKIEVNTSDVDVDLTGYATEEWVKRQDYVTNSDVDEFVGDRVGQVEQKFYDYYTKTEIDGKIVNLVPFDRWETNNIEMLNNINRIDETIGDINNLLESI